MAALLDVRIGDDDHHEHDQNNDNRVPQPGETVTGYGNEQISLDHFPQHEAQDKGRAGPAEKHHEITEQAEYESHDQVGDLPVGGVTSHEDEQQHEGDDQATAHVSDLRQLIEHEKTEHHGDDVGDHQRPDHREGDGQMLGQHIGAGDDAHDQKTAEQDRHRAAARHAESDGRDQFAAFLRVVCGAGAQHAANVSLAEALAFLGVFGALNRMSVGHPLCHAAPRARQDADENADDRATKDEPKVAKGGFDAF